MRPLAHPRDRVLVTIPISHYCEKARWALERAGLDYLERPHVQLIHRLAVRRAGGGHTAPVLVTPDGVFADSRAILFYADALSPPERRLYPPDAGERAAVLALEERFDTVLGPEGRRWMYFQTLGRPRLLASFSTTGVPGWERRLFPAFLLVARPYAKRYLDISPSTAADAERLVDQELDAVAEMLADGRRYLVADRFTAADLAFAALAAAVLVPPQYGVPLPQPDEMPPHVAARVRRWRAHPAGAFALRLFAEERVPRTPQPPPGDGGDPRAGAADRPGRG